MENPIDNYRYRKLTLLHSNDLHGDFLPESINDELIGGMSLLSGYIKKVRSQEPSTLYCTAGDMFSGSVIDSEYRGLSTIDIMNMLSPDAATLGNHEVDYGIGHLLFLEKCAKFSLINANMRLKMNHTRLFNPCKVIKINGIKVLFIGLLTPDTLTQTKKEGLVGTYLAMTDPVQEVQKLCAENKNDSIDLTVLLTHIGIDADRKLAGEIDPSWGVDIIIGGHSHTFMERPEIVNDILIVQVGSGTGHIGRFDLEVDTENNCISKWEWQTVEVTEENCPADLRMERCIRSYKNVTDLKYGRVLCELDRVLTHPKRNMQTELGGFLADALMDGLGADIMLMASGSVRSPQLNKTVTFKDFIECFPFDDAAYMLKVNGRMLKKMLLRVYRDDAWEGKHTEFYQLSKGLDVIYSRAQHKILEFKMDGRDIADGDEFMIALQEYHYLNLKDSFDLEMEEVEALMSPKRIAASCQEILLQYFEEHPELTASREERLKVLD